MIFLGQITPLANNIKIASIGVIRKFHQLIFEYEGDRNNRKRLREFTGVFEANSQQYNDEINYMNTFVVNDLILISNIIGVDHNRSKQDSVKDICNCLMNLDLLEENFRRLIDEAEETANGKNKSEGDRNCTASSGQNYRDTREKVLDFL